MIKAWVATHTGLPSFHTDEKVTRGKVVLHPGGSEVLFSDPLAVPGIATIYRVGSQDVSLTRRSPGRAYALVSRLDGRAIAGLRYLDTGDPGGATAEVSRFPSGATRWPATTPLRTGKGRFLSEDPDSYGDIWALLTARAPLIVAADATIPGLPGVRTITVDSVTSSIFSPDGWRLWDVAWTEYRPSPDEHLTAPVVTWGDWELWSASRPAVERGWRNWSEIQLAQKIAGMPS